MTPIIANAIWPALFLEKHLVSQWPILIGLAIEYLFVRKLTMLSPIQALWADVAMNGASALLGIILLPLAGIIWEFFPRLILDFFLHSGTFNPGTWVATFVMAVAINAFVEWFVLQRFFKQQQLGTQAFWILCIANAFTVAVAFVSLIYAQTEPECGLTLDCIYNSYYGG
jgi:hypothetical protein